MNDNQGHDVPNVATLNVTDNTNVRGRVVLDQLQLYITNSRNRITYIVTVIMHAEQYKFYNHFLK